MIEDSTSQITIIYMNDLNLSKKNNQIRIIQKNCKQILFFTKKTFCDQIIKVCFCIELHMMTLRPKLLLEIKDTLYW